MAHPLSQALRGGALRLALAMALALLIAVGAALGTYRPAENDLQSARFELAPRPASGQIHIVEMDAASMAAIRQWPWPRDHYARLVEQLDGAGVRSIAFDVDFSSVSSAAGDEAFARALAASRAPVILPTFSQAAGSDEERRLDSLPIERLREHAQLASVSIRPDPDGFVRRMPLGRMTSGLARPSLSTFVARGSGEAGRDFPIDFAIAANTIPRHSFTAIERGTFDPADLRGKDVLIGATSVELFDRYAVPNHGVIPGVVVQALAAETLLSGTPIYGSWELPLTLATLLALFVLGAKTHARTALAAMLCTAVIVTGAVIVQAELLVWFEIVPALLLIALAGSARMLAIARADLMRSRKTDRESGLPNQIALQERLSQDQPRYVVAAMLGEFETLKAVLDRDDMATLLKRVVERFEVSGCKSPVCHTEDRVLSWGTALAFPQLEESLEGLKSVMRIPIEVGGRRIDVAIAFGVANAAHKKAIANAAHAASAAWRKGENWHLHEDADGAHLEQRILLMGELDAALREGHILLHYQPKLDLNRNRITCAEGLVRWEHPVRGMLSPDSFIALAEESGRIEDLTLYLIERAIKDVRGWSARGLELGAAVNISARLLCVPSFAERAEGIIARLGLPAAGLTFEVTESADLVDPEVAIATLNRFRDRGIAISVDDYGTGQSTLSYLKRLPISELKIDRSFVQHAHIDRSDAMLVRSTVQLAHQLGLKVVAEGIEDAACLDYLRSIGCDYGQGYFIARPMTAESLAFLVAGANRQAA